MERRGKNGEKVKKREKGEKGENRSWPTYMYILYMYNICIQSPKFSKKNILNSLRHLTPSPPPSPCVNYPCSAGPQCSQITSKLFLPSCANSWPKIGQIRHMRLNTGYKKGKKMVGL